MNREDFYRKMDEIFDLDPGTIRGQEKILEDGLLDSISILGLISMVDKNFKITLSSDEINTMGTVDNLFDKIARDK